MPNEKKKLSEAEADKRLADLYSRLLEIGHDYERAHPRSSYWVEDWTSPNGIEPTYHRSFGGAWSEATEIIGYADYLVRRYGADGHRVTIVAAPIGRPESEAKPVVSVWEDMKTHEDDGLFKCRLH